MDAVTGARKRYSMYVWTTGFDPSITGCDVTEFLKWNTHGPCFTHVWDTAEKRKWLWITCNLPGREISTIFISDVHRNLQHAYDTGNCALPEITRVKQMLVEGHTQVPGLKIYGLYAVSDQNVSEKHLVKYIVYYNDVCASTATERFDGVATNNEYYANIKCGDMQERLNYLDNLKQITVEAAKQAHGTLLTHYSVSWHWGQCSSHRMMTWSGKTSDAVHHMIDIFDSVDVQVGYILPNVIAERMITAGYDYAVSQGKEIFATLYTDKTEPCQITFFPDDNCHWKGHSEQNMFAVIDALPGLGITHAQPCIHYFRGVYSSGGHPDWPAHKTIGPSVVG